MTACNTENPVNGYSLRSMKKHSRDFLNAKDTQSTPWSSFSAIEQLLLVKMMSYEHAAVQGAFGDALIHGRFRLAVCNLLERRS